MRLGYLGGRVTDAGDGSGLQQEGQLGAGAEAPEAAIVAWVAEAGDGWFG